MKASKPASQQQARGKKQTWSTKDTNDLTTATAVVRNGDNVAQSALVRFSNTLEDIDEVVSGATAREDNDARGRWYRERAGTGCDGASRGRGSTGAWEL